MQLGLSDYVSKPRFVGEIWEFFSKTRQDWGWGKRCFKCSYSRAAVPMYLVLREYATDHTSRSGNEGIQDRHWKTLPLCYHTVENTGCTLNKRRVVNILDMGTYSISIYTSTIVDARFNRWNVGVTLAFQYWGSLASFSWSNQKRSVHIVNPNVIISGIWYFALKINCNLLCHSIRAKYHICGALRTEI